MISWLVEIDFGRDGTFSHVLSDVTDRVRDFMSWSSGWQSVGRVESNVSAHISPVNTLQLVLNNDDGQFSFEKTSANFYNLLFTGLMVRITITDGVSHTFTYYTNEVREAVGEFGRQIVEISCTCAMPRVQRARVDLEIQTDVLSSVAIQNVINKAVVPLPYNSTYFFVDYHSVDDAVHIYDASTHFSNYNDYEEGYSRIPYVGDVIGRDRKGNDEQKIQMFIADVCTAEGFGRWFYQPRDQKFHFHHRYHDTLQTSQYTLSSLDYVDATPVTTRVYNDVEVHYFPRVVSQTNQTIYSSDAVPIEIHPGRTKQIRVKYHDPAFVDIPAAALSIVEPDITDVIITDPDGGDRRTSVYQSNDLNNSGGTFYFENTTDVTVTIDTLRVRGKAVTLYQPEIAAAKDGASIGLHNWVQLPSIRGTYITDGDFAQGIANFLISRHKNMHRILSDITLVIDEHNFEYLGVTIGDVVTIEDEFTGHDTEYVVLGELHNYDISSQLYRVTWFLRDNDTTPYFMVDVDYVDSQAIIGL